LVNCDANIRVTAQSITCPFAQNTFYAAYQQGVSDGLMVYSPALRRSLPVDCRLSGPDVRCDTRAGGTIRFSQDALSAYTESDADAFEESNDVGEAQPSRSPEAGADDGDVVNCSDTTATDFPTPPGDPNGLDGDNDGIACES